MSETTYTLARRWFEEVWNERSRETIYALVDPACVGHHEGEVSKGPADVEAMRDRLVGLMPDIKVTVEDIVADGDNAAVRWKFTGTPLGASNPLSFSGMTWLKFKDGRIVEGWDRWNQGVMLQQLQALA